MGRYIPRKLILVNGIFKKIAFFNLLLLTLINLMLIKIIFKVNFY